MFSSLTCQFAFTVDGLIFTGQGEAVFFDTPLEEVEVLQGRTPSDFIVSEKILCQDRDQSR